MTNKQLFLNLGCGNHCHPDWVNVDFVSSDPNVIRHNLLKGIPFNDKKFDVVYHSHVLEHFPKSYAPYFIKECFRVLKSGGIIRVAVPDLETIVILYLKYLNLSIQSQEGAKEKYEWMMVEMIDQMVRQTSGGEMIKALEGANIGQREFIYSRIGMQAEMVWNSKKNIKRNFMPFNFLYKKIKDFLFRSSGESHCWMYDKFSLGNLLIEAGFQDVVNVKAQESSIPNFSRYQLDVIDGKIRKPDSLFMEGVKL